MAENKYYLHIYAKYGEENGRVMGITSAWNHPESGVVFFVFYSVPERSFKLTISLQSVLSLHPDAWYLLLLRENQSLYSIYCSEL